MPSRLLGCTFRLDAALVREIDKISGETNRTRTGTVRTVLRAYIEQHKQEETLKKMRKRVVRES